MPGGEASAGRGRIVVTAHIDSKEGSPGAIDNAAGVSVLLLLAELLADYSGPHGVELVPFNGEDYYASTGQVDWLKRNEATVGNIALAVNIDGAGYYDGVTEYSTYGLSPELASAVEKALSGRSEHGAGALSPGEPWFQSDHSIFVQRGVPAVAVTSERFRELSRTVTHTTHDVPEIVDPARLTGIALALKDLIASI